MGTLVLLRKVYEQPPEPLLASVQHKHVYIIYNTEIDEIYDCEDQRLLNSVLNIPGLRLIEENAYLTSAPENSRHQPRPLEAIAAKRRVILATTFSMKLYINICSCVLWVCHAIAISSM